MKEKHKEAFELLKKNAEEIKKLFDEEKPNLALLDKLLRERNRLFLKLSELFTSDAPEKDEMDMMADMIKDNNTILEKIEQEKARMEREFNKKEADASKISHYSTKLKG